jgi:PIN domain nuclease of toxin-antitoxin system
MRLIADTHVLIWAFTDPGQLPLRIRGALEDLSNEVLFSAVSAYEIEYKRPQDRLLAALPTDLESAVAIEGFGWRSITARDAIFAGRLPRHHRNPWDRVLVAQCLQEGVPLISRDAKLADYGVTLIW